MGRNALWCRAAQGALTGDVGFLASIVLNEISVDVVVVIIVLVT